MSTRFPVLELAKKVIEIMGSRSTISFHTLPLDKTLIPRPDVTLPNQIPGWEPKMKLEKHKPGRLNGSHPVIEFLKEGRNSIIFF
jgi:hypothetical protein